MIAPIPPIQGIPDKLIEVLNERFRSVDLGQVTRTVVQSIVREGSVDDELVTINGFRVVY